MPNDWAGEKMKWRTESCETEQLMLVNQFASKNRNDFYYIFTCTDWLLYFFHKTSRFEALQPQLPQVCAHCVKSRHQRTEKIFKTKPDWLNAAGGRKTFIAKRKSP